MSYITTLITEYTIFGKLHKKITSINKLKCRELIWYENGAHEEILYSDGKKHGKNRLWYANNKVCKCIGYIEGKKQSELEWYNSGELWKSKKYVNDVKHGEQKKWYKNGKLQKRVLYVNGEKQINEEWFENGQQKHRIDYEKGYVNGGFKMWDESGCMIAINYPQTNSCCIIS